MGYCAQILRTTLTGSLILWATAVERRDYATALRLFALEDAVARHRYTQAAKWYREAADQGVGEAQFGLGLLYARGQGVPQDDVQAYMWFELSAAQGDQAAVSNRDATAQRMTPEQIAEAQKLAHDWRPKPEH
jgi:TPR repeat protein